MENMSKEELETRINQLNSEFAQVSGAYNGAINECRFWLDKLTPKDTPPEAPTGE